METSDLQQQQQHGHQGASGAKKQNSPSSSPEVAEAGFVMVPPSLAGDSSKHKTNQGLGVSPLTARRIGARPGSLPGVSRAHSTEPIPVRFFIFWSLFSCTAVLCEPCALSKEAEIFSVF